MSKIVQNCVTSFKDDPLQRYLLSSAVLTHRHSRKTKGVNTHKFFRPKKTVQMITSIIKDNSTPVLNYLSTKYNSDYGFDPFS